MQRTLLCAYICWLLAHVGIVFHFVDDSDLGKFKWQHFYIDTNESIIKHFNKKLLK